MRDFVRLLDTLEITHCPEAQSQAIQKYLTQAPPGDSAWAVYLLSGHRLPRTLSLDQLKSWVMEISQLPEWLFQESLDSVKDVAEAVALLTPVGEIPAHSPSLGEWVHRAILDLKSTAANVPDLRASVIQSWHELDLHEKLVFNRLLTGNRIAHLPEGVLESALAARAGISKALAGARLEEFLASRGQPSERAFLSLLLPPSLDREEDCALPLPFSEESILNSKPGALGEIRDWQIRWHRNETRAQLVRRDCVSRLWSLLEKPLGTEHPEIEESAFFLPDGTVLEGQLVYDSTHTTARNPAKSAPKPAFEVQDLLMLDNQDLRPLSFRERHKKLLALGARFTPPLRLAPELEPASWSAADDLRYQARDHGARGLTLTAWDAPQTKRIWKCDPLVFSAVMIYGTIRGAAEEAQATFALSDGKGLIPIGRASLLDLPEEELTELEEWIQHNTREKFGPVRSVPAVQVFDVACDATQGPRSAREKREFTLEKPRILRWRREMGRADIDPLSRVLQGALFQDR